MLRPSQAQSSGEQSNVLDDDFLEGTEIRGTEIGSLQPDD